MHSNWSGLSLDDSLTVALPGVVKATLGEIAKGQPGLSLSDVTRMALYQFIQNDPGRLAILDQKIISQAIQQENLTYTERGNENV